MLGSRFGYQAAGLEPIGFDLWEFDPESPQYIPLCFELPTNLRRPFGVRCCYNGFLTYIQDVVWVLYPGFIVQVYKKNMWYGIL